MRKTTILAAGAALMFAPVAFAQQQPAPAPAAPAQSAPEAQSDAPDIQSVSVVDITELPEATQTQVNDLVSKRSEADMEKLRSSIDATPKVKAALDAKGMTSAQVIAATMRNDGALTLITKKKG